MKDLKGTDYLIRLLSDTQGHKQGDWENFKLLSPKATVNIKCILTPSMIVLNILHRQNGSVPQIWF